MSEPSVSTQTDTYTLAFIQETASILIHSYNLRQGHEWVWKLAEGWESTIDEVIENWIHGYVRRVTPSMAETQFQMLFLEFEQLYFSTEVSSWNI